MSPFFAIFAVICSLGLSTSIVMGVVHSPNHLMVGLVATIASVSVHCLIFAIFTGSGKDTRELVEDLSLDTSYVKKTKVYKRTVFPKALYAILFLLMTTCFGGYFSAHSTAWVLWAHGLFACFTYYYNLKVFWLEYQAIKENAAILKNLNQTASHVSESLPKEASQFEEGALDEKVANLEWGTHVYAFGKFLVFMAWNTWFPYIYMRFIMGMIKMPLYPFLTVFLLLNLCGYYLCWRYRNYRPVFAPRS